MTDFSRRARWLNELFPASKAPQVQDPGVRSDDVSLVQQYDGGAWPLPDSSSWIRTIATPSGITETVVLLDIPVGFVYRLFALQVFRVTGGAGLAHIFVRDVISVPNTACLLAPFEDTTVGTGLKSFKFSGAMVFPAGLRITGDMTMGSPSILQFNMYGCLAPAGSVFNC